MATAMPFAQVPWRFEFASSSASPSRPGLSVLSTPIPPPITVEHTPGGMVRIEEKLGLRAEVEGLDQLVRDGAIRSYARNREGLVVYADSPDAASRVAALPQHGQTLGAGSLLDRARELLVPPNLSEACAPEYLRFRSWCLAGAVMAGAINFMGARVNLDAVKVAFDTSANAATAGFVNGLVFKVTSMGASFMAQKGDADPKKCFLVSSLISSANSLLVVGLLSVLPRAYWPVYAAISLTSAVAGTLGGAAGCNIFNHIARGNNKGLVGSKNGNQDMLAEMMGAPLAMGVSALAGRIGANPYVLTVAALGPMLAMCNLQAAKSLQFESMSRSDINGLAGAFVDKGEVPQSPRTGVLDTLKSLFRRAEPGDCGKIHFAESLDEVVAAAAPLKAETMFGLFRDEKYLVATNAEGEVVVGFRRDANMDDVFKASIHARLVERALASKVPALLRDRLGLADRSLLVELAYRALPKTTPSAEALSQLGWNPNPASLGLKKIEGSWGGPEVVRVDWITLENYKKLLENPDEATLKALMKPAASS